MDLLVTREQKPEITSKWNKNKNLLKRYENETNEQRM